MAESGMTPFALLLVQITATLSESAVIEPSRCAKIAQTELSSLCDELKMENGLWNVGEEHDPT
jgi:hypothetical protein